MEAVASDSEKEGRGAFHFISKILPTIYISLSERERERGRGIEEGREKTDTL